MTFAETITAKTQTICSKCEIWSQPTTNDPGTYLATLDVVSGAVTDDETQIVRRTLSLTGFDPTGTLVPVKAGDLLHVDSGHEMRIFRGLVLAGGVEWYPLGVFRITQPTFQQDANGITFTFQNNDRTEVFSDAGWLNPFVAQGNIAQVIFTQAHLLYPGLPCIFTTTPHEMLPVVWGGVGSLQQGSDPGTDLTDAATACGLVLYIDETGNLILDDLASPPSQPNFFWTEGEDCLVSEIDKDYDRTQDFNVVVVESANSQATTPLRAVVYVPPAPTSPRVFSYTQATYGTLEAVVSAAYGLLYRLSGGSETVNMSMAPDPRVRAGMLAQIYFPRVQATKLYVIEQVVTPLEAGTQQTALLRPALLAGIPPSLLDGGLSGGSS